MKKISIFISMSFVLALSWFLSANSVSAERVKDIASIQGVRENELVGYGLVVGLNGTGDKSGAALQSVMNMLFRMGLAVEKKDIKTKNAAAVMITATLPPFAKTGNKIDALVSALVDAKSLQGGTLLLTPLKGPDGKVYALAQGPISIGGFAAGSGGTGVQKNHPTVGKIPNGVTIEKEINFDISKVDVLPMVLNNPDFTTASNLKNVINKALNGSYAISPDPSSVEVTVPPLYKNRIVDMVRFLESLNVSVDQAAKVIINERTGTVIIGENVKLSPVAISHGSLTIEIRKDMQVSQPPPLAPEGAETVVAPSSEVDVREQQASLIKIGGVTLSEIVNALNKLGVTPRDLIAILQSLKAAGALKAELEII